MSVGMALTRGTRAGTRSAGDFVKTLGPQDGADISRAARLEELRQMVASGRYQVQTQKLALRILVRALKREK